VSLINDALHHFGSVLSKVACAKEGGVDIVYFQNVQDAIRADNGHLHTFFQGIVINAMLAWHVEFFCVET
jgi:hypothetical protein